MESVLMFIEAETTLLGEPLYAFKFDGSELQSVTSTGWWGLLEAIRTRRPDLILAAVPADSAAGIKTLGALSRDPETSEIPLVAFFAPTPLNLNYRGPGHPYSDPFGIYEAGMRIARLPSAKNAALDPSAV